MKTFSLYQNRKRCRPIAKILILILLFQCFSPAISLALTNGPASPEFSSFEPVSTSDMVSLFTGDFTYNLPVINIPGPDGAGYALSLSYQSGVNAEQEASWVGFGWNLNPGAINRYAKGIPDDYKDASIYKYNKARANWSVSGYVRAGTEVFGKNLGISATKSIRLNNYTGLYSSYGLGLNVKGIGGVNFNKDASGITAKANLNPSKLFDSEKDKADEDANADEQKMDETEVQEKEEDSKFKLQFKLAKDQQSVNSSHGSSFNNFVPGGSDIIRSQNFNKYWGIGFNFNASFQVNPGPAPVGFETGIGGSFNLQKNKSLTENKAYGYMHNLGNYSDDDILSDYHVEKGGAYTKRDYHLGIPFSDPDVFSLTGEGLGGSFRYWNNNVGHYYPTFGKSFFYSLTIGLEAMVGPAVGVGLNLGAGLSESKMRNWLFDGNTSSFQFDNAFSNGHFRFSNDMGGSISASADTKVTSALVKQIAGLEIPANSIETQLIEKGTSSNIEYQTRDDYLDDSKRFDKTHIPSINSSDIPDSSICAFNITNADGNKYVYGLPVFNRNEGSFQVSTEQIKDHRKNTSLVANDKNVIYNNHLAYQEIKFNGSKVNQDSTKSKAIFGEFKEEAYSKSYLLTQIFTHDYIDIGNDGVDEMDHGGWTNFHYTNKFGFGNDNFYNWRTPYTGLNYSKNQISDIYDDMGSMSYGEKEVYYLKAIETKSHVALFILNDSEATDFTDLTGGITPSEYIEGSDPSISRKDGMDADIQDASNNLEARGTNKLSYLEKIVLFSKERMSKPLKTINFEYDYTLCENLPNNEDGTYPTFDNSKDYTESGKLTLKKVWFSYEGKFTTRISPYEFDYVYDNFKDHNDKLKIFGTSRSKYNSIIDFANQYTHENQNPNYNNEYLDAWGNINFNQKTRNEKLQSWPYQGSILGTPYDPAAWHLKKITLPSGGEIHVQYEEKDYAHVQNRRAMTLVSLNGSNTEESDFIINTNDLGLSNSELEDYVEILENHFITNGKKIYFKFLYDMTANNPDINNCHSEYITGWAIVENITRNGNQIRIKIQEEGQGAESWLPRRACYDYLAGNFYGKESNNNNCTVFAGLNLFSDIGDIQDGNDSENKGIVKNLLESFGDNIERFTWGIPVYGSHCIEYEPALSYFKLPTYHAKRGGGVRVKNLLLFDPGLEDGDARLYGHSYKYETTEGISSGVATNEPSNMREENALVDFLPRKGQSWYSKITTGPDKEQTEGPLGESLLPSPSIGYGRVVVEHIHVGKSSTGFTEHNFYTTKDYPFDKLYPVDENNDLESGKGVDFTNISDDPLEVPIYLPMVFFNYSLNTARLAQGYRFVINNMNGQPKSNSTYGLNANDEPYLVSSEQFEYYEVGEKVPILKEDLQIEMENPGKELEVAMEMKRFAQNNFDLELEADVSIAVWPPVYVTIVPTFSIANSALSTHTTSKIISYPVIQKRVTNFQEGIYSTMENIAFSDHTGKPLIQKISDDMEQDGQTLYRYSTNIPASYHYTDMGQKLTGNQNYNRLNVMAEQHQSFNDNPIASGQLTLNNIINSQITTFANGNEVSDFYDIPTPPTDLQEIRRAHQSYVFKRRTTNALTANGNKIASAGIINNYQLFDRQNVSANDPRYWVRANEITKYSTNGLALEEKNALGIYSAALLGHNDYVPILNVVNAKKENVYFESFEETSLATTTQIAHTGEASMRIVGTSTLFPNTIWTQEMVDRGALLKVWIHADDYDMDAILSMQLGGQNFDSKYVAKSGEWALHHINIPENAITFSNGLSGILQNGSSGDLYVDDIKIQPYDSEMKCYVYEKETLRLLAEFDDNHFALLYQYNEEGKLVRKIIETERGIKTIQETQYHTPLKPNK